MLMKKRIQKGFSLLELLLVVAVGAVLILAGLAVYQNVTSGQQASEIGRLVTLIKEETNQLYKNESTYTGLNNTILISAGIIPQKYATSSTAITAPGNRAVTVTPSGNNFTVALDITDNAICTELGTIYSGGDAGFVDLTTTGTGSNLSNATSPTAATVAGACNGVATMTWEFN